MFHALLGCLKIRTTSDKESPYYPVRYLRRQLVAYMCHHRELIWKLKEASLRSKYGVEGGDICPQPISYKEYLLKVLKRGFWGEDIILQTFSIMTKTRITVLNAEKLEEYRISHNLPMKKVDIVLVFNGRNHYSYAGESDVCAVLVVSGRRYRP